MGQHPALQTVDNRTTSAPPNMFARDAQIRAERERERQLFIERDRAERASLAAMTADRDNVLAIASELHTAAKTLFEGKIGTSEMISHEFNRLMQKIERAVEEETAFSGIGLPMSSYSPEPSIQSLTLPSGNSVQAWSAAVDEIISEATKLPNATGSLPDTFKQELATIINKGFRLCMGGSAIAQDAKAHLGKATTLYKKLSGTSYI